MGSTRLEYRRRMVLATMFATALALIVLLSPHATSADSPLVANVWVAHLAPFANTLPGTAVDIAVTTGGNTTTLTNIQFKDSTDGYLPLPPGPVNIQITPSGGTTPVLDETLTLADGTDYTVAAIGGVNGWPVELFPLEDNNTPPNAGTGKVRIGHLAPFADTAAGTAVDLRLQNGTLLPGFGNIEYKDVSQYLPLPASTLDLIITAPGGSPILFDIPPFQIQAGTVTSVFAIGDGVNQPLDVIAFQTYPVLPPTAVTLSDMSSRSTGASLWLLGLGAVAVGTGAVLRRRRA